MNPNNIKYDFLLYPQNGIQSEIIPKTGLNIHGKLTIPYIKPNCAGVM